MDHKEFLRSKEIEEDGADYYSALQIKQIEIMNKNKNSIKKWTIHEEIHEEIHEGLKTELF